MRRRLLIVTGVLSITLLLAGMRLPAVPDEKPSAAERAREDFELMKLFAEAYEQIDARYVREIDRRQLVEAAIRGMASHLDQYSAFIPPGDLSKFEQYLEQEFTGIGIHVRTRDGKLEVLNTLPQSPAQRAGIGIGDAILAIDGTTVEGLSPGDVGKLLAGPTGRQVSLKIQKSGGSSPEDIVLVRETIHIPTVISLKRREDGSWDFLHDAAAGIGYLRMTHFSTNTTEEVRQALSQLEAAGAKALIVDVRSNPGGRMDVAVSIADLFLDSGVIVSIQGRNDSEKKQWKARRADTICRLPLAVLVNRNSASASEVLSGCLQDNARATIVGERTWGKSSVQSVVQLESGKSALKLTTATYFRPSGVNIHRFPDSKPEDTWGIRPSEGHLVELTKDQWAEWTKARESIDAIHGSSPMPDFDDAQLNHAVQFLREQLSAPPAAASP